MKRLTLAAVFLCLVAVGAAKEYWYPSIETEVRLSPDGDARIQQIRTYYFSGSFSWAFVELKKRGAEDVVFERVEELVGSVWRRLEPLEVRDGPDALYVKWGYSAEDEERSFRLTYTAVGAVTRWQDVAEFYWKTIEDEHEAVERAAVSILLPGPSPELFKVYVHSRAKPGELEFGEELDEASIRQAGIPKNTFQEIRVLADPALFPGAPGQDRPAYERILGEEKRNFILSTLQVYLLLPLAVMFLLVLPLVLLLSYYFRYGREPDTGYDAVYEHEPPTAAPPQVVAGILHQRAESQTKQTEMFQGLFATLLGLAGKGQVTVEEQARGKGYVFHRAGEKDAGLDDYDRAALDFLFGQVGGGAESVTDDDLRKYGRAHAAKVRGMLGEWYDRARDWWRARLGGELLDRASSGAYRRFTLLLFVLVAAGTACAGFAVARVLTGLAGPMPWVLAGVLGVLLMILFAGAGRSIYRWTVPARTESLRWERFRKFLREFSAIEQAPIKLLPIWEQFYVYAVALGVAEEFLKNVGRLAAARGEPAVVPAWFVGRGMAAGAGPAGLAGFQSAMQGLARFSSNFASINSSFAPRSSSGGGFSGGGGGGGGGGSSGAG